MNRKFDESSLSAFMDGELDTDAMQAVDRFLGQDPDARAFILNAVRGAAFLKAAANATLHEQVPERLLRPLHPAAHPAARAGRRHLWRAAAAILLAFLGFGAGIIGGSRMQGAAEPAPLASLVDRYGNLVDAALENNTSGLPREWRPPGEPAVVTVTPVRTYRDTGQRYYREYRIQVSSGKDTREVGGLAYRTDEGRWKTTALFF